MKKLSMLDLYLIFSIIALITYTIIEQVLSIRTGIERSTLTTCFYAAFGGETFWCAVIKVFKLKNEKKEVDEGVNDLSDNSSEVINDSTYPDLTGGK